DMNNTTQNSEQGNPTVKSLIKLGLDVDLKQMTGTAQWDHQHPKPAMSFLPERLASWVREQVQAGGHSLVISPVRLHPERRRKNDRLDSRQLCLRLSRYLDGQQDELPVIRIPTLVEQQRRELGRQRKFWGKQVRQLENHGRALRLEHELKTLPSGWAGPRKWKELLPELSEFLRTHLTQQR
ncbi:MAG: hypothetical protein ACREDS_09590, partial [Limisphaerales bacterium]